jgi:hypothetical protein
MSSPISGNYSSGRWTPYSPSATPSSGSYLSRRGTPFLPPVTPAYSATGSSASPNTTKPHTTKPGKTPEKNSEDPSKDRPWHIDLGKSILELLAGLVGGLAGARLASKPSVKKSFEKMPSWIAKHPGLILAGLVSILAGAVTGGLFSGIWQKSTQGKIDKKQLALDILDGSM